MSNVSVTVVTAVTDGTLAFSARATEVASVAAVGVGVALAVTVAVLAEAGAEDVAGAAWAERPLRRTAATPRAANC